MLPNFSISRTDDGCSTWHTKKNVAFFPDFYRGPEGGMLYQPIKMHADEDGQRAWVLFNFIGIIHTFNGGGSWGQDSIPASPGMMFTDLVFNAYSHTLWLTSDYCGIWKYEIHANNINNITSSAYSKKNIRRVISANNGISIPLNSYSKRISVDIYSVSGRLVYSKTFANTQKDNSILLPLAILPSGHFIGNVRYYREQKKLDALIFNVNIIK